MAALFQALDRRDPRPRIQALKRDFPRQLGRMSPAQALRHCQMPLRVALGELRLRRNLMGLIFGGWAKRQLLAPGESGRNLPTAAEFRVVDECEFETERERLLLLVDRLGAGGPDALTKEPHPFFGRLSVEEWDALQWKHLGHHLRQFGG